MLDLKILEAVIEELKSMERDGRRLFIICPIHQEILSRLEDFQSYKTECQKIPVNQRKYLIFMIVDMPDGMSMKEPYRFIAPLKLFCSSVFSRNTLGSPINFQLLRESGIDGVGLSAFHKSQTEAETIHMLDSFCAEARASKVGKTFLLDIPSLSLTTSAVCSGFDFLSGAAIHDDVERPDQIYRYRNEDLISSLIKK